jgi:hypothetical protein
MKSPFPGMDPFIESSGLWEDFHYHLVESIASLLADAVPPHYLVKCGKRMYGVSPHSMEVRDFREPFVEIYAESQKDELVTCVEVLSPTNKRFGSEGWDLYLRKRQAMLLGQANFVEMDLLRGGRKMPMLDPWPTCPYTILSSRRQRAPHCRVWKAYMHKPLPAIKVPLLADDPQVSLELQPIVDSIYRRYRYDQQIDYGKPCSPPLTEEETAYLQEACLEAVE